MKIQLEILSKNRGVMHVNVYEVSDSSRNMISTKTGTVAEIKQQIEREVDDTVDIEKSIFEGWY